MSRFIHTAQFTVAFSVSMYAINQVTDTSNDLALLLVRTEHAAACQFLQRKTRASPLLQRVATRWASRL